MDKIPFEDGVKLKNATVTINEQEYEVTPAQYQGTTPLSAFNLNKMQDIIDKAKADKIDYISVYNNNTQTFTKNAQGKVNFNSKKISSSNFNLTNNEIVCKKNGIIILNYKIYLSSNFADLDNIIIKVYKNSSEIDRFQYRPSGNYSQIIFSGIILQEVSNNDTVHLEFINYNNNTTIGNTSMINANSLNLLYVN